MLIVSPGSMLTVWRAPVPTRYRNVSVALAVSTKRSVHERAPRGQRPSNVPSAERDRISPGRAEPVLGEDTTVRIRWSWCWSLAPHPESANTKAVIAAYGAETTAGLQRSPGMRFVYVGSVGPGP